MHMTQGAVIAIFVTVNAWSPFARQPIYCEDQPLTSNILSTYIYIYIYIYNEKPAYYVKRISHSKMLAAHMVFPFHSSESHWWCNRAKADKYHYTTPENTEHKTAFHLTIRQQNTYTGFEIAKIRYSGSDQEHFVKFKNNTTNQHATNATNVKVNGRGKNV